MHRQTTTKHGLLRPNEAARHIDLRRYEPDSDLDQYVERFWSVHWDLVDPYDVRLISHPCVNASFTPGEGATLYGVGTTTSIHPLAGAGWVFGVKFRPGGYRALTGRSSSPITDRSVPLRDAFGPAADALEAEIRASIDDHERVLSASAFLGDHMPAGMDETYELLLRIVATMVNDRSITRVEQVADQFGLSIRTFQRICREYVGVPPKWLITRYRLHDGAQWLAEGIDVATVATELGWFDQAHFTRDFGALIGTSPAAYAHACAADAEPLAALGSP